MDSVSGMRRIAVRLPDALVEALDMAATELNRSRDPSFARQLNDTWRTLTT